MKLVETYKTIRKSVVAIAVKPATGQADPVVPTIIGTGFVVGEGLIATNDHVVRCTKQLADLPGVAKDGWPISAVLFHLLPDQGMCQITMEVLGVFAISVFQPKGNYYGQTPDIGFIHVNMRGLPRLDLAIDLPSIEPGIRVATAGFPMGTEALRAPGYIHQLTPTLQEGIISAVLPFPCKTPHALMLNMMSQGGASGSPIFALDCPQVIGVLYGGLEETYSAVVQGQRIPYHVPTNFTYCVPAHFLKAALEDVNSRTEVALPADSPTLEEALKCIGQAPVYKP